MSRVRQFGGLRSSKTSSQANLPRHSDLLRHSAAKEDTNKHGSGHTLCVNCVNKSLSKQKQLHKSIQKVADNSLRKELEQSRKQLDQVQNKLRAKKIDQQQREMLEYNAQAARQHSEQKEKERNKQLADKQQQQQRHQREALQKEADIRREKLLTEKWLVDIQNQIAVNQSKKGQQKTQKLSSSFIGQTNVFGNTGKNRQNEQKSRYRSELKEQIAQAEQKKRQQKVSKTKQLDIRSNPIIDWAEQRQKKIQQQEELRKKLLLEDAKRRQQQLAKQKQEIQEKKKRERKDIQIRTAEQEQRLRQIAKKRQQRMSEYIKQVKEHIHLKQTAKQKQKQVKLTKYQQTFYNSLSRTPELGNCDGCDKLYPNNYLARFQEQY